MIISKINVFVTEPLAFFKYCCSDMKNRFSKNIARLNLISSCTIILVLTLCFVAIFTFSFNQVRNFHLDYFSQYLLESKRNFIKNTVYRTIAEIDSVRAECLTQQAREKAEFDVGSSCEKCSEDQIKDTMKMRIRTTELLDNGYIWVNEVVNYDGGDDYAIRLVHPNLVETEGMFLSTDMEDVQGNRPYLEELEGVKKDGELFFTYWFKEKDSDQISEKLTFSKLYKPFNWIIATGVYVNDIEEIISNHETEYLNIFQKYLLKILVLGVIAVLCIFVLTFAIHRRIRQTIDAFTLQVEEKNKEILDLNLNLEKTVTQRTEELQSSQHRLRESEAKYLDLYDNAPDMFASVDAQTSNVLSCNQTLCTVLGYEKNEILGHPVFNLYPASAQDGAREAFQKFTTTGEVINAELQLEGKDGSVIDVFLNVSAVRDEAGEILCSRSSWRDISQLKSVEDSLRQMQKMDAIGTLAGGIAHDFNNILTAILGYTQLGLDDVEQQTEMYAYLGEIYKAGNRAKELVQQILTFARKGDNSIEYIHVSTLVKGLLTFIRSTTPSSVAIESDIQSDSYVHANSTQLYSALLNVLTNGVQAMDEQGDCLQVSVSDIKIIEGDSRPEQLSVGDYVLIEITDNGVGISPENLKIIFEPYFTTKEVGKGTGIGLAVVHGVVEQCGGVIGVVSTVGHGTTFTLYFPVSATCADTQPKAVEAIPQGDGNILFVDDEESVVKVGCRTLESMGYKVTTFTSSVEALQFFKENYAQFDLVITDMTMPHIMGDTLAGEIHAIRPDIPIILCTGFSNKISEESALSLGMSAFMHKPVIKDDLAQTVHRVLKG